MKKLRAFYFSGTGNTRFAVKYLAEKLSVCYDTEICDICKKHQFKSKIEEADLVLLGYPIYASSPPIPMREFIVKYGDSLAGKQIAIAETQYFFSGDGGAALGRALEKRGADVKYIEHFNMPNNICDSRIFKIKNGEETVGIMEKAKHRMDRFASRIISESPLKRGANPASHAVGYFCQRMWWRKKENSKRSEIRVDPTKCRRCGKCIESCPVNNLMFSDGKVIGKGKCVICYRCVNLCPVSAFSLLGDKVYSRYEGIDGRDFDKNR